VNPPVDEGGSVLESAALGTGLERLTRPCGEGSKSRHPVPPATRPPIGIALSGGGFRATFAGLGVLRYLADAGLLADVRFLSTVSGGSLANGMVARSWPELRTAGFTAEALDEHVIDPMARKVAHSSLKTKLLHNVWRAAWTRNRTDVLAWAFDSWFYGGKRLADLDPQVRWIFNAANLTTGVRFGFERDVVGDYVLGWAPTGGTNLRVAQAVAASAAVPGAFAPMKLTNVAFPCANGRVPKLLDGGAYDNTGLEALDSDSYDDVFTIAINAGGVFVTGRYGRIPLVRDLARANSLLYRQSTSLRTRWMVERFEAHRRTPTNQTPPAGARQGVLFALATSVPAGNSPQRFKDFVALYPEHRTYRGKDLAFVPTVFDRLDPALLRLLVYRGWWLTGATLARWQPDVGELPPGTAAPHLETTTR
jgi:NTE family protein